MPSIGVPNLKEFEAQVIFNLVCQVVYNNNYYYVEHKICEFGKNQPSSFKDTRG